MSVLFVSKTTDVCRAAQRFLRERFSDALVYEGERHDPMPEIFSSWSGDYIISFLSPWILPASLLRRATAAAVNFHPGPPEYPGIGCYNFALYEEATSYGVVCHHMQARVDTGRIVSAARFPIRPDDTVASLKDRSMASLLVLFQNLVERIARGEPLPDTSEHWTRQPFTRRQLDELCRITSDMTADEVRRRVRATVFPGAPGPYVELHGFRFEWARHA